MVYSHPAGVGPLTLHGRPVLTLPRNGRVAIDDAVLALWKMAAGRTSDEVIGAWPDAGDHAWVTAALACLAEARLLAREGHGPAPGPAEAGHHRPAEPGLDRADAPLVSAIVISYDSLEWLPGVLDTLLAQRYPAIEPIVVDNGSPSDPTAWIRERYPSVQAIRLPPGRSFAHAVNQGVAASRGRYALILNPDIELAPDATAHLVRVAEAAPDCAAVAAKLLFWWAPAFLNGIGNRVEQSGWGTDNFVGHLDLGQFDAITDVPSVCFAAALIRRAAWNELGPADEGFPMYYEDVDWSYRARLAGYRIAAAPRASVQHVFGGKVRSGEESDLSPFKTGNAAYGRLRFAMRILSGQHRRRFLHTYVVEDKENARAAWARGDSATVRAYARAWARALASAGPIAVGRRAIHRRRRVSDAGLLEAQRAMPGALMWHGIPDLSRDAIAAVYQPLLANGRTRAVPEFASGAVTG